MGASAAGCEIGRHLEARATCSSAGDEFSQALLRVGVHRAPDLVLQLGEGSPQQARDVHLGDAEDLPDLGLGLVVDEAQSEDRAFPLR